MKILAIEDDEVLLDILVQSLSSQQYIVETAADGITGWEYAQSTNYDLILLDVGLPKLDGIALCQKLRSSGCATPILLMTAKDATSDRIRGLDAGADDYLHKPLDLAELQARVRALLRRGNVKPTPVLEVSGLRLDPSSCFVSYKGKQLELTPKEYNLLELFLRNPTRVFSRGNIIEHLWTFDDPPLEESVKAHIKGLRHKLKAVGAIDWIENVYGLGYRLNSQAEAKKPKVKVADSNSPPDSIEQQFNQQRDKLWLQYQGLMIERLEVLQNAAQAAKMPLELRQSAEQAAHKLAGVLGMFDRDTGTTIAREIEQLLLGDGELSLMQISQLRSQVAALGEIISPTVWQSALVDTQILLVNLDKQLSLDLQQLAQLEGMCCHEVETLKAAKTWLEGKSPSLVVLRVGASARQQEFSLIAQLANSTPPIPVIAIASADGLVNRVAVASAGGKGFLVTPVTASQVWDNASKLIHRPAAQVVKVLVVDDDPAFIAALRPMLEPWGIKMTGLDDPLRFWQVLESVAPDLAILDVEMPQLSGIELCQAVRTDPVWQELPIVFLTAHRDIETIQKVFAIGADDYVVKPVVGAELINRITNRLERNRLLKTRLSQDPLTKLANQPQSNRELEQLISQAKIEHCHCCLALLYAPQLRQINVQYSHAAGNQVLQRWSSIFQSAFSNGEVLGYWGNGEFVVGMPRLTKAEASDRLAQVLTTVRQQIFTTPNGNRYQASCNFAVVQYPINGVTVQELYQSASSIITNV